MRAQLIEIFRASHFIPMLTVTALSLALALRTGTTMTSLGIALTIFSGQLIVGWSNDLIDFADDLSHNRLHKPLVAGGITPSTLKIAIGIDSALLLLLTFLGPLASNFGFLHLLAVASAVGYNLKLKTTVLSFLPYLFSFGSLPIIILGASNYPIELWYGAVGALFGVGLHLANVFKDLPQDLASGILGLPQVLGEKLCRIGCAICFGTGALILYLQTQSSAAILVGLAAAIFLRPMPAKFAFPYSMALGMAVMLVFITTLA